MKRSDLCIALALTLGAHAATVCHAQPQPGATAAADYRFTGYKLTTPHPHVGTTNAPRMFATQIIASGPDYWSLRDKRPTSPDGRATLFAVIPTVSNRTYDLKVQLIGQSSYQYQVYAIPSALPKEAELLNPLGHFKSLTSGAVNATDKVNLSFAGGDAGFVLIKIVGPTNTSWGVSSIDIAPHP